MARLWGAAASHVGEACLEGIARVQRCSLEGRAAMSLDLQGVQRALSRLLPPGVPVNLRLVDSYVKVCEGRGLWLWWCAGQHGARLPSFQGWRLVRGGSI